MVDVSYLPLLWTPYLLKVSRESTSEFEIPQLPPGRHYGGPDVGEDNLCTCNTVAYSLVSACAACQGSSTWVQYVFH